MREVIDAMFTSLAEGPTIYQPSKFWQQLNEQNVTQLEARGIGEIKRTLAQNYFTWVVGMRSPLFRHLLRITSLRDRLRILSNLPAFDRSAGLKFRRFYELQIFTRMVWILAERTDRLDLLARVEEPEFGKPFDVQFRNRLISQDLANSILELYAILEGRMPGFDESFTVCEIGAGYGRNAYAFLSAFKNCKYIIADIPPALYVSQEYISTVFSDKRIMKFRPFDDIESTREEFEAADVVFMLPHQLEAIRDKSIDYVINISSFHEMTHKQVEAYFDIVDRIARGYFYIKQWKSFDNADDALTISEADYPVRAEWRELYRRTPNSHPQFFEALFKID